MEDVSIGLDDLTLKIEDIINEEQAFVALAFTGCKVNLHVLLKVFPRVWKKNGAIEIKALDYTTFLFHFKEIDDLELVLQRIPWNFNNAHIVVKKTEP